MTPFDNQPHTPEAKADTAAKELPQFWKWLPVTILLILLPFLLGLLSVLGNVPKVPGKAPAPLPPYFFVLIPIFVVYMFCAVVASIAFIGGWQRLAGRFRAEPGFAEGQRFRMQSASIGGANYNNALTVHVSPRGLHLAVPFPFRVMHPPLLIPWPEIKAAHQKTLLFGRRALFLTVGDPKIATIVLSNPQLIAAVMPWLPQPAPAGEPAMTVHR